ncbi:DUF616 domain-containing protein [Beggiatoa alba]|nr:DUF616 domain-containing protein [Beggiatoa alba]
MDVFVCTVLMGDYDFLLPIHKEEYNKNWKFICYTDKDRSIKGWEFRELPDNVLDLSVFLQTRYVKLFCQSIINLPGIYIYIDANISLGRGFGGLYDQFLKSEKCLGLFKHPDRVNIFDEFDCALKMNKLKNQGALARKQIKKYSLDTKFTSVDILFENNIIFRKHSSKKINDLMSNWWLELKDWPTRDQFSLPYVLFKSNVKYFMLNINIRKPNDYVFIHGHREKNFRDIHAYIHSRGDRMIFRIALVLWQPAHNILIKILQK